MRKIATFLVALLVCVMLFLGADTLSARASGECFIDVQGTVGVTICGGEAVGSVPLPTVRVTETVVKRITDEKTEIIRVPGPTETIRVPGPTSTATVNVPGGPGPTETVTRTESVTASPSASSGPTQTVTETIRTGGGQGGTGRATMDPDRGFYSLDVDFGDDTITAAEAGIGLLTLLALVGLILIAMYAGYTLGYKESEREDTHFMRALRDTMVTRGNHS